MTTTSVKVALRIRPLTLRELNNEETQCVTQLPDVPQIIIGGDRAFTFDYVYSAEVNQHQIYEESVRPLVDKFTQGYNATILAYGQTGSGKTFTMGTGKTEETEQRGIVPRAIGGVFEHLEKHLGSLEVSFMELYNEDLVDLLNPQSVHRPAIREDSHGNMILMGVERLPVNDHQTVLGYLQQGSSSRTTKSTDMNQMSSRSHAIFTLYLTQQMGDLSVVSKMHFVDLAGSERIKRTGAAGDRAREGIAINGGLLALGNVISALGSGPVGHVPYRDSKLTRLLQDSLGGNSETLMVACVGPSDADLAESLNTCRYANRARNIRNKVAVNFDKRGSVEISMLKTEVARLRGELSKVKQQTWRTSASPQMDEMKRLRQDNLRLVRELEQMKVEGAYSTADLELSEQAERHEHQIESVRRHYESRLGLVQDTVEVLERERDIAALLQPKRDGEMEKLRREVDRLRSENRMLEQSQRGETEKLAGQIQEQAKEIAVLRRHQTQAKHKRRSLLAFKDTTEEVPNLLRAVFIKTVVENELQRCVRARQLLRVRDSYLVEQDQLMNEQNDLLLEIQALQIDGEDRKVQVRQATERIGIIDAQLHHLDLKIRDTESEVATLAQPADSTEGFVNMSGLAIRMVEDVVGVDYQAFSDLFCHLPQTDSTGLAYLLMQEIIELRLASLADGEERQRLEEQKMELQRTLVAMQKTALNSALAYERELGEAERRLGEESGSRSSLSSTTTTERCHGKDSCRSVYDGVRERGILLRSALLSSFDNTGDPVEMSLGDQSMEIIRSAKGLVPELSDYEMDTTRSLLFKDIGPPRLSEDTNTSVLGSCEDEVEDQIAEGPLAMESDIEEELSENIHGDMFLSDLELSDHHDSVSRELYRSGSFELFRSPNLTNRQRSINKYRRNQLIRRRSIRKRHQVGNLAAVMRDMKISLPIVPPEMLEFINKRDPDALKVGSTPPLVATPEQVVEELRISMSPKRRIAGKIKTQKDITPTPVPAHAPAPPPAISFDTTKPIKPTRIRRRPHSSSDTPKPTTNRLSKLLNGFGFKNKESNASVGGMVMNRDRSQSDSVHIQ